jgi:hypothetical protein
MQSAEREAKGKFERAATELTTGACSAADSLCAGDAGAARRLDSQQSLLLADEKSRNPLQCIQSRLKHCSPYILAAICLFHMHGADYARSQRAKKVG